MSYVKDCLSRARQCSRVWHDWLVSFQGMAREAERRRP